MKKYLLVLFAVTLLDHTSWGQTPDSSVYYAVISDTAIKNLTYTTAFYKNGFLKYEGWVIDADKWLGYHVKGRFLTYHKNGHTKMDLYFPLNESDSITLNVYKKNDSLLFYAITSYENYSQQRKVWQYAVIIDPFFRGWNRIAYRNNGEKHSWGAYNRKGRCKGKWIWYDMEGKVKQIRYHNDKGKLLRKEKYEDGQLVNVKEY